MILDAFILVLACVAGVFYVVWSARAAWRYTAPRVDPTRVRELELELGFREPDADDTVDWYAQYQSQVRFASPPNSGAYAAAAAMKAAYIAGRIPPTDEPGAVSYYRVPADDGRVWHVYPDGRRVLIPADE